jgi:hypothetical protein
MQTIHTKSIEWPSLTLVSSGLVMTPPLARVRAASQSVPSPTVKSSHT